jgi:hypothetical protein
MPGSAFSPTFPQVLGPLIGLAIYLGMVIYLLKDLYRPERQVYGGDKTIWLLVILFLGILGWGAYLLVGRQD